MKQEKKKLPAQAAAHSFKCDNEVWEKICASAQKNKRSKKAQIEIIIEAGLQKLEEDEKRFNKG